MNSMFCIAILFYAVVPQPQLISFIVSFHDFLFVATECALACMKL
jgi:hypothetical protein